MQKYFNEFRDKHHDEQHPSTREKKKREKTHANFASVFISAIAFSCKQPPVSNLPKYLLWLHKKSNGFKFFLPLLPFNFYISHPSCFTVKTIIIMIFFLFVCQHDSLHRKERIIETATTVCTTKTHSFSELCYISLIKTIISNSEYINKNSVQ